MALPQVRSFDIFDTVLTRSVGAASALHLVQGRRLRDAGVLDAEPVVFATARERIERRLVLLRGRPPRLREIYEELLRVLGAPEHHVETLCELEYEVERKASRALPGARAMVAAARSAGARVVFLSEGPFPAAFLAELLDSAGLLGEGDAVYCAAETGLTKAGGALFEHVATDLGVSPSTILHVGDEEVLDVAEARLSGWRAELAGAATATRYERLLHDESLATDGVSSRLAGAGRLARLRAVVDRGISPARAAVAAGVAAPMLVSYGMWLLEQARRRRISTLYFLSRDGEVMLDVVRPLAVALGYDDIELRYLYGSRAAWRPASLHYADTADLGDWLHGDPSSSPRTLLHRVGLDPERARQLVEHPLLDSPGVDAAMDARGLASLRALVQSEPLLSEIRRRAAQAAATAVDYLRQEGLGGAATTALVDVGWLGRTTRGLVDVMDGAQLRLPDAVFFIGLRAGSERWSSPRLAERQHAFLFDQTHGRGVPGDTSGRVTLIEMFCAGTEGSTLGYRRDGAQIRPELVSPTNASALTWGLAEVRWVIHAVVEELLRDDVEDLTRTCDLRDAVDGVLRAFWEQPTSGEIEAWGSFPFEADDTHRITTPLAAPVSWASIVAELRLGRVKIRPSSSWRAGTAGVSPWPWRQLLEGMALVERRRPALRGVPRRLARVAVLRRPG